MDPIIKQNQDTRRLRSDEPGLPAYTSGAGSGSGTAPTGRGLNLQGTPFVGDLRIGSWNAQALLARHKAKRAAKWDQCWKLLKNCDILALQETHSTVANTTRATLSRTSQFWWSHETQHTGGVGIAASTTFLANFRKNTDGSVGEWIEVTPGRAAILRLEGPKGDMDIATIYMPTGSARRERDAIRDSMARHIRTADQALTILVGDWNFVEQQTDRMGLTEAQWTMTPDTKEYAGWQRHIFTPFNMAEIWQEDMTHHTKLGTSRLDRA